MEHTNESAQQEQVENVVQKEVAEKPAEPNIIRVLHVQVTGAPTQEKLLEVADAFAASLRAGDSQAVVTDAAIMTRIEYAATEQMPIDLIHVRAAMTPAEVIAIAYQASNPGEDTKHWNDLTEEARNHLIALGLQVFNTGVIVEEEGQEQIPNPQVFKATIEALKVYATSPTSAPMVKVWSGETNLTLDSAWNLLPFHALKPQLIFQMDNHPGKYFATNGAPYIQYEALSSKYAIEVDEAVVSGSKPMDESDLTKGFTLTWKKAEPIAEKGIKDEGLGDDSEHDSGNYDENVDDEPGLTPEQDPTVVTDVESKDVQA